MSKTYTTVTGDIWDYIAYREMGSCKYTNLLIDANRQYIDTAIFSAGAVLNIPDVESKAGYSAPPWKKIKRVRV